MFDCFINAIAPSIHNPMIATHLKSNSDRLFSQTHQMFKAIALSFHKPTIASHPKSPILVSRFHFGYQITKPLKINLFYLFTFYLTHLAIANSPQSLVSSHGAHNSHSSDTLLKADSLRNTASTYRVAPL